MIVTINGEQRDVPGVPGEMTVTDLIAWLGLSGGPVAVELNREIVPRAAHTTARVSAGDAIEIVHFVGGG